MNSYVESEHFKRLIRQINRFMREENIFLDETILGKYLKIKKGTAVNEMMIAIPFFN
ncbi:hypothetical protein [Candidatus Enterococcus palustris]|uniref:hypothetical protein n=1 Tax=Candidatus Enterococcus palustris TaxID=1834189 RepID=UPI0014839B20|nr:hypothetical protein [Enterococcus sp. 7F3_DIV0205]